MKGLLKPLENFKGTQEQEAAFVSGLYNEIDKVTHFPFEETAFCFIRGTGGRFFHFERERILCRISIVLHSGGSQVRLYQRA